MQESSRWTEIRIAVPIGWQELVADSLGQAVCTTVQIGDHSMAQEPADAGFVHLRTYLLTEQDSPAWREDLRRSLADLAQRVDASELRDLVTVYTPLPQEDYANAWKASWKAFRLRRGARALRVEPPWAVWPETAGETRLVLEPGGAFGSGRHATTRTCMGVALERIRGGERVLDAGSGSGVLAVTSVLLGASHAIGFDIDAVATHSAQDLAASNSVSDQTHFFTGGMEAIPNARFDVVFANIYSDIIVKHAEDLAQAVAPLGWIAFSGCPVHHYEKTRRAIEAAQLRIEAEHCRGLWYTFVAVPWNPS